VGYGSAPQAIHIQDQVVEPTEFFKYLAATLTLQDYLLRERSR